jgi:hypothetical protein
VKPAIAIALLALLFLDTSSIASPAAASASSGQKVRFVPSKGKVRVEGTSSIDDWQVEARSIEGFLEAGPEFLHPGQQSSLSAGAARVDVAIEVHALKSIEKDGKPFSNKMDDIMYESLKARYHDKIRFQLDRLVLKHAGKGPDDPREYDARGQLSVAGITNEISMPISVQIVAPNQLRIWGSGTVKMTDFQIDPPSPKIALGLIKTGDQVKLSFDWVWSRRAD